MKTRKTNIKERNIYTYERLLSNKNGGYEKEVIVVKPGENGEKKQVLRGAVMRLPQRFIHWLFGDCSQVYLLDPGKSVQSVDVKEI